MPALQHVYITAHGEWTYTPWVGEKAQIGLRLAIVDKDDIPAVGSVFNIPTHGDVAIDSGSSAGTHGTLTKSWTARIGPTGSVENFDADQQKDVGEDVWTFLDTIKAQIVQGFRWTHVKIAPLLADGSYGAPSALYQFTTPLVGTCSTSYPPMPPEVAVAVSLRAPVIGRRGRGRIYMPAANTGAASANGDLNTGNADAYKSALVTLVTNLNNLSGASDYQGVLMVTSAGKTTAVRPAEVRVGSHFDVQRRRQAQVPEVYRSTALT